MSGTYKPCVPHLDLTITKNTFITPTSKISNLITEPLVKCKEEDTDLAGSYTAFASGKRSAILIDEDENFIRLKGCGNLD